MPQEKRNLGGHAQTPSQQLAEFTENCCKAIYTSAHQMLNMTKS